MNLDNIQGGVSCITVDSNEQFVAIGGQTGNIKLCLVRQLHQNLENRSLTYHKDRVTDIKFFQRGSTNLMISASADRSFACYSM